LDQIPEDAADDRWLRLDAQLCFAIYSAGHAMTRVYKPLLQGLGLTYPQYLVMLVLWQSSGVPVKAIGDRLKLDSGTLTPLLKRLEAGGLICRQRDAADERQVLIHLTPAGAALKQQALQIPPAIGCATGLSVADITALRAELTELRRQLDAASPNAT
jgi:MarR family transcriptional regulator, organic hydroperoxide resistance regulator